jgi:hypothetical protein
LLEKLLLAKLMLALLVAGLDFHDVTLACEDKR